ncbi:MAG: DNA-protecting protein DprA [Clostridiales bacterium]|nr:DNA-protecting protein DprA [Clostridiales bacterium]
MTDYKNYWIWLATRMGQGSRLAVKLVNYFGNAKNVYCASPQDFELAQDSGFTARELTQALKLLADHSLDDIEEIVSNASRLGQRIIVPTDEDYPKSLINLRDAPMALYVVGNLPQLNRDLCISVVGTRTMSDSGRRNAYAMGYGIAAAGSIVVSGMALGSDGMALTGAVSAGGRCIAVLGGGADVIYPKDHANLYNTILKRGAVISEYPPGSPPSGYHFPVRNRIISGLSAGSVVIEADMKSGALITARHAVYQGRNVFALPGEVGSPCAEGTNELIKNGAFAVTCAEDVLGEYEFLYPHSVSMRALRRAMRGLDIDAASEEAMARMRVSARGGRNYYGNGAYGGRSSWLGRGKGTSSKDKKASELSVSLGNSPESEPKTAKLKNKSDSSSVMEKTENNDKYKAEEKDLPKALTEPESRIDIDLLDEINIRVYNMMKPDVPMIPDELVTGEISVSDVLSSLSMLEIAGAVESGAGGYFLRRSVDNIEFDPEK